MSLQVHLESGAHSKAGMCNGLSWFVMSSTVYFYTISCVRRLHGRKLDGI